MPSTMVRKGTPEDIDELTAILTDGFTEDPVFRWMFTTERQYERLAPGLFRWMAEEAVEVGDAFLVEGKGVLLGRRSSEIEDDEQWVTAARQLREVCGEAATNALAYFDAARENHPTGTPHWYGEALAVRPGYRSQGIGSSLLHHCAAEHVELPIYGDASSARSAALYGRLGFTVIGSYRLGGDVPLTSVWRKPQLSFQNPS